MGDPQESKQRYKFLLGQRADGSPSPSTCLPRSARLRLPLGGGKISKAGVAIDSLEDMERLLPASRWTLSRPR